jgi:RNA polymerase sigma factor (sigma-70 family)
MRDNDVRAMEQLTPTDPDAPRYPHRDRDAGWIAAVRAGDERAFGWIYDAWFDRVFDLSMRILRNRDAALEVTQDTFLSAWRNLDSLSDPRSFGGWLLRIARNASLNRQEKERRSVAVDDQEFAVMESVGASSAGSPAGFALEDRLAAAHDPQRALEDNEMQQLVWQAASALGERDTEVLDLQLRQGLTPAELGEVLGINRNAANQLVHRVRKRFEVALKARLLWRGTRPACADLNALLVSAGIESFSAEAVKVADKHAPTCEECSARRESRLQPAAMFAAVPLIAVPVLFKQQTAYALEGAGVPMSGSAFGSQSVVAGAGLGDGSVEPSPGSDGGSGDGSVHPEPDGAAFGDGSVHPVRRGLLMAGAAVVVVVALMAVITGRLHDPTSNEVVAFSDGAPNTSVRPAADPSTVPGDPGTVPDSAVEAPTSVDPGPSIVTSLVPGPTVTAVTTPGQPNPTTAPTAPPSNDPGADASGDPGGGDLGNNPPTIAGPGPSPQATPSGRFTLTPTSVPQKYAMNAAPTLQWVVNGNFSQHITGPNVDRSSASGSVAICPGAIAPSLAGTVPVCSVRGGTYVYELQVFGADGTVLVQRHVTLTVRA